MLEIDFWVWSSAGLVCYTAVFFVSSRKARYWGGALRDDTKNGCVADYHRTSRIKIFWSISKTTDHSYHFQFFFRSDPLSSTYFGSRFNLPKENRCRPSKRNYKSRHLVSHSGFQLFQVQPRLFNRKGNAEHFFACSFLKRLPLAILRLFQGFYHFLVRYKKKFHVFLRE